MRLKDYTKAHGLKQLADRIGTSAAYLSQIAHGHRACSEPVALAIERETGGAVTVADLRPQFAALLDECGYRKGSTPEETPPGPSRPRPLPASGQGVASSASPTGAAGSTTAAAGKSAAAGQGGGTRTEREEEVA